MEFSESTGILGMHRDSQHVNKLCHGGVIADNASLQHALR